jgi:hypothetical protein
MALTIEQRPEKTLDSGLVSKWNASATPLQYKFSSNLFPVNNVDPTISISSYLYSSSDRGTVLTLSSPQSSVNQGDYITIEGAGDINGVHKVLSTPTASFIVIDFFTSSTGTGGTAIKYYKGYKALVKVFAGSPEYHPYNTDGSKPQTEIGTIEVNFDQNNEGVCNVRNFIKPDMSAGFDYDNENSHDAWTSFAIEYAEIWDNKTDAITFNEDIIANCFPFVGFSNSDFNNGLTDWEQTTEPSRANWGSGVSGQVSAIANGENFTQTLYQDIDMREGNKYTVSIDYDLQSATVSDNIILFLVVKYVGVTNPLNITFFNNTQIGTGNLSTDFYPSNDVEWVGFYVQCSRLLGPNPFTILVNNFQISSEASNQCKYSSFSIFGAKQFQNSLGGNFGDYLANSEAPGKLLTNFEALKYPFYINSLIPASTFSQSEGGNSVFLETFIFDSKGVEKEYVRQQIENKSDGVYTVNPLIETESCDWDNGTTQIISVPDNLLLDGDGGTYENTDVSTWDISELVYSTSTPNQVGGQILEIDGKGVFNTSSPFMQQGETLLIAKFDTVINVIQGQTYTIDSDVFVNNATFAPPLRGNSECFFIVEGYDLADLNITTIECPPDPISPTVEGKISTTFTATTDTVNIIFAQRVFNTIPFGTGGSWDLDNTTVKGPIAYLSEKKPIKAGVCCGKTNQLLRWKNNLGGWDKWNFTRFRTFKENTKNKIEIQRDITQDWDNYFINGDTEYDYISQEVRQIMTLRSELLTQDEQKNLNQIRSSIRVQAFINDRWVTVTVKGGNYTLYDENEKIREVSFDIELPRTLTQEQ